MQENINRGYKNGFIVGNKLTVTDCKLWCFIRHFGHCQWREGYYKYIDDNILDKFPLLTKYKIFISNIPIIKQFNIKWRERHKGYKLKLYKYPKCYVWNKYNHNSNHMIPNIKWCDMKLIINIIIFLFILLIFLLLINDKNTNSISLNGISNIPNKIPMGFGLVLYFTMNEMSQHSKKK